MLDHRIRNGVPGRLGPSQSLHTSRLSSLHCEAIVIVSHWHKKKIEKIRKVPVPHQNDTRKLLSDEIRKTRRGQFDKCTNAQLSD